MIDSPSGRVLEKASRWYGRRTETCSGEKYVFGLIVGVYKIFRTYRPEIRSIGAARVHKGARLTPYLVVVSWNVWTPPEASWVSFGVEIFFNFYRIWTLFGMDFL